MQASLIATPTYELTVDIDATPYGYSFFLSSFIPTARRPEVQRHVQATCSHEGLLALRRLIDDVLIAGDGILVERPKPISWVFPTGKGPTAASLWAYHMSMVRQKKLDALQRIAIGLNRYRGKRSGGVAVSRCAAGSAMLLIEAIRLGLQQEQHHEPIVTWHHAAASTHARGHAPAQARAEDADLLRACRAQVG